MPKRKSETLPDVSVSLLEQEVYSEPDAARLLQVPTSTLGYWLHGGERNGNRYQPIIRREPIDRRWVTWAEFVEAGWLKTYRRSKGIPMKELRAFIVLLREEFDVPYPLAHEKPFVSGKSLVRRAQQSAGVADQFRLVDDQLMLTYSGQTFVEHVMWDAKGVAQAWRPVADNDSSVLIQPDVRFGRPSVGGVSTASLWDESEVGATDQELAEDFELSLADVRWALSYEKARHAKSVA